VKLCATYSGDVSCIVCSGDVDEYKAGRDDYAAAAAGGYDYDDDDVKDVDMYYAGPGGGGGGSTGEYMMGAAGKRSDTDTFV